MEIGIAGALVIVILTVVQWLTWREKREKKPRRPRPKPVPLYRWQVIGIGIIVGLMLLFLLVSIVLTYL